MRPWNKETEITKKNGETKKMTKLYTFDISGIVTVKADSIKKAKQLLESHKFDRVEVYELDFTLQQPELEK